MNKLLMTTALVAVMSTAAFANGTPTAYDEFQDVGNANLGVQIQTANETANNAERRAGEAEAAAAAANSTAGIATTTAIGALGEARDAQETADRAEGKADAAQVRADDAYEIASNAGVDAINNRTAIENLQEKVANLNPGSEVSVSQNQFTGEITLTVDDEDFRKQRWCRRYQQQNCYRKSSRKGCKPKSWF